MKLTYAFLGLAALGGVALSVGPASAMPFAQSEIAAPGIIQAHYCGRSYGYGYGGGYYSRPRYSYGYGGGWRGRRWY
ncbi:MAG: hypothetical protein HY242_13875 [Afipia sp.]|nr:hypothetical protein [Afipia sp.]